MTEREISIEEQIAAAVHAEQEGPPGYAGAIDEVAAERNRQIMAEHWDLQLSISGRGTFTFWEPKDHRRNLIRAAALIVAEIERLDRVK